MSRSVLQGFLCAGDTSLEGIASLLGLEVDVVKLYEGLFFNVRNREVLRGGSFNNDPDYLCCSYRNNNDPDNRNNNRGFRVVCVGVSARKVLARNARRL